MAVAQGVSPAVLHSTLLDALKPYLAFNIVAVDEADVLMGALKPPLSRQAYNYILSVPNIDDLLLALGEQRIRRGLVHKPQPSEAHQRLLDALHRAGATEDDDHVATLMAQHLTRVRGMSGCETA